jgi:hypothetical protein
MGNRSFNSVYLRSLEYTFTGDAIEGDFIFELNIHAPRNNVVEYFYFLDAAGDPAEPVAGTVSITMSSGSPVFQTLNYGEFEATKATQPSRTKPNGYGAADFAKVSLSGVIGSGVAGFKLFITQSIR